jgi:hypothetical protein
VPDGVARELVQDEADALALPDIETGRSAHDLDLRRGVHTMVGEHLRDPIPDERSRRASPGPAWFWSRSAGAR